MAAVAAIYNQPSRSISSPSLTQGPAPGAAVKAPFIGDYAGQLRSQSVDDIHAHRQQSLTQQQMQNRRRSVGPDAFSPESFSTFVRQEVGSMSNPASIQLSGPGQASHRPGNRRNGSTDSTNSGNSSRPNSSNRNSVHSNHSNTGSSTPHEINPSQVPPRGSSTDGNKRVTAPSPLSKPVNMAADSTSSYQTFPEPQSNANGAPPALTRSATQQLEAIPDVPKKGMKNRLRRAFSFGSAAELRKVSAVNNMRGEDAAERARLRQEKFREEQNAEQLRIAQRQEEAGLGEGIYNGQGNFFTGSTDNISVSSTASSASIMIRKMGKGMKKSTRSLVGLFRPKSVVGVPAASGPVTAQASMGQVSMVTVEAEREKVNVNADARDQTSGGTGFPKLENNSLETPKVGEPSTARRSSNANDTEAARKSFVGGAQDRAEVLAAVKKGILKRSSSSSPIIKPSDPSNFPENQRPHGKQRSDSVRGDEDYFISGPRFSAGNSASAPTSPASAAKYNVSFSPRITFHDTWPSGEYDRRGEIATCNRLTPMLAQQIKEELNTFKMEMAVHEESKVYTHFF
ncbi:uncharacterized protein LAJ45_03269 [Morchella importuna]|nr:uncharacterized protein LAJ45_03269 [Morchella importuna]KAH8152429.1 hypothetical protein LAJ45_03269 [Morchella importuna]